MFRLYLKSKLSCLLLIIILIYFQKKKKDKIIKKCFFSLRNAFKNRRLLNKYMKKVLH